MILGRVWAHKILREAFYTYQRFNLPFSQKIRWEMDQGIFAALFLQLRFWEVKSGLLNAEKRKGFSGPYGLIGGMIDLEYSTSLVGVFHNYNVPEFIVYANCSLSIELYLKEVISPVTKQISAGAFPVVRSRPGAAMSQTFVSFKFAPHNILNDSSPVGVPYGRGTEPALWHMCGPEKKDTYPQFRQALPLRIVLDAIPSERLHTQRVFQSAPPTRVWAVGDKVAEDGFIPLLRSPALDLTTELLCKLAQV